MRKGFLLVAVLAVSLLSSCSSLPRYQPELAGRPTAEVYIDGRPTRNPWLYGIDLFLNVFERADCKAEIAFSGSLKGKAEALSGPFRFPAGERVYLRLVHVTHTSYSLFGPTSSFEKWRELSFVPEAGAVYHLSLDTREDDFTEFALFRERGGQRTRMPMQSWKECS